MNQSKIFVLIAFLVFLSACRTTEAQLRQYSPTLLERTTPIEREVQLPATPTRPGKSPKLQWFLLTAAILAGVVMVFATDRGQEKRHTPARRPATRKRRKK